LSGREVSALDWSPVQSSHTDCDVSERDREAWTVRRPWLTRGCCAIKKESVLYSYFFTVAKQNLVAL
jgi:hypothetical protein